MSIPIGKAVQALPRISTGGLRACVETPENSLLQELLSHNVDEDAARGKQKLSRSRCA
jgi:hypothetical protein